MHLQIEKNVKIKTIVSRYIIEPETAPTDEVIAGTDKKGQI